MVVIICSVMLDMMIFWSIVFVGFSLLWVSWVVGDLVVKLVIGVFLLVLFCVLLWCMVLCMV